MYTNQHQSFSQHSVTRHAAVSCHIYHFRNECWTLVVNTHPSKRGLLGVQCAQLFPFLFLWNSEKWKAPPVAAGSPRPCRGLPSTPFKSLLESLQHIVLCLIPQSIFFIQHLSERCDVSKSFVHLFLPFQLVSQPLAFSWKLLCEHLTSQILTASSLLHSASVLIFFPF